MPYYSQVWGVEVRDEIAREFAAPDGAVDDNLAGLHEVRARISEERVRTGSTLVQGADAAKVLSEEGWRVVDNQRDEPAA